jgi:hypothetical protein
LGEIEIWSEKETVIGCSNILHHYTSRQPSGVLLGENVKVLGDHAYINDIDDPEPMRIGERIVSRTTSRGSEA